MKLLRFWLKALFVRAYDGMVVTVMLDVVDHVSLLFEVLKMRYSFKKRVPMCKLKGL